MPEGWQKLAPGVYAIIGSSEEAGVANAGRVGNTGVLVGPEGTVLIGLGTSWQQGQDLLDQARSVGAQPVVLGIVTNPIQEFVMAASALRDQGIPVWADAAAGALIAQRCGTCLKNLQRLLGDVVMAHTEVVRPSPAPHGEVRVGGRRLRLIRHARAHSPGDLAVLDVASGVLFTGALVSVDRVPDVRDADVSGWDAALASLQRLPSTRLVPGYGRVVTAARIAAQRRYLRDLQSLVGQHLRQGDGLVATEREALLPRYAAWAGYPAIHARNVHWTYLRREADGFRP